MTEISTPGPPASSRIRLCAIRLRFESPLDHLSSIPLTRTIVFELTVRILACGGCEQPSCQVRSHRAWPRLPRIKSYGAPDSEKVPAKIGQDPKGLTVGALNHRINSHINSQLEMTRHLVGAVSAPSRALGDCVGKGSSQLDPLQDRGNFRRLRRWRRRKEHWSASKLRRRISRYR